MATAISQKTLTSEMPPVYGSVTYTSSRSGNDMVYNITVNMWITRSGGWRNNRWAARLWVNDEMIWDNQTIKAKTSGAIGTAVRSSSVTVTVSNKLSGTVPLKVQFADTGLSNSWVVNKDWGDYPGTLEVLPPPIVKPTLSAISIKNITSSSASLSFSVTDDGGDSPSNHWIEVFSDSGLSNKVSSNNGNYKVTGLSRYTTYWVRGYATNSAGTTYTNKASFTTLPVNPTLSGLSVSSITDVSAYLSFSVTDNGGKPITSSKIDISETNFGSVLKTIASSEGTVTGLLPNKTYYARGYASNGTTNAYTTVKSFTTIFNNPGQPGVINITFDTGTPSPSSLATVTWGASTPGTSAVSGYRFQIYKNGAQVYTTDTESTSTSTQFNLSDYSFVEDDTLQIKIYAYSKDGSGAKHLSSVRESSILTIVADSFVQASINGAEFKKCKLYLSVNGSDYVLVEKSKFTVLK